MQDARFNQVTGINEKQEEKKDIVEIALWPELAWHLSPLKLKLASSERPVKNAELI